ncbi:MAG: hypothetical protein LBP58_03080 [Azoarcus sp.]|jgi:hypothetical protein|nr:hypothetical protein [Azoarcus sp.]
MIADGIFSLRTQVVAAMVDVAIRRSNAAREQAINTPEILGVRARKNAALDAVLARQNVVTARDLYAENGEFSGLQYSRHLVMLADRGVLIRLPMRTKNNDEPVRYARNPAHGEQDQTRSI